MRITRLIPVMSAVLGLATAAATIRPALADIIFEGTDVVGGAGFGALPRALTIQSHGPGETVESGCIAPDGVGGLIEGNSACANTALDVGGNEAPPLGFPKQSAPTLSSLGITQGSQVGILFDAIQPQNTGNKVVTVEDLTLKVYNGATLIFTASGTFDPMLTNPGNGKTDYLFGLDATEAAEFDAAVAGNFSDTIALDSTISFPNQSSGPDSYAFVSVLPEPSLLPLLGPALLGLAVWGGKRSLSGADKNSR